MNWKCRIFGHNYFAYENPYKSQESKTVMVKNNTCVRCGYFDEKGYKREKDRYELIQSVKETGKKTHENAANNQVPENGPPSRQ